MNSFSKSDYEYYPRTLPSEDFWGQVRRTVNGQPVSEEQILMIVDSVKQGVRFEDGDVVLDLACGNGALSRYFFDSCSALLGVDRSEYLISVAKQHFEKVPRYTFLHRDAADYVMTEEEPERITKAICYGSFSFFSRDDGETVLAGLHDRFVNLRRVFIGNLPDRDRSQLFYGDAAPGAELDDHSAQIGIWRTKEQFEQLGHKTGWKLTFGEMPDGFYARHYRYDALLERA
ncbi:MAG: Methyltransferase domain [Acidimicrobiaceae bacterium]|nr:Methyltransferase domain [Acidimicrobiaceae bacterium]